jgi:antitoxin (DNA-binding transcriptional repressor) of toxin-antitoxin stability system
VERGQQSFRQPFQWDVAEDIIMSMASTHISEAEAVRDFAGLLARVRAGEEIVIESGTAPVAVLRPAGPPRRSISESIALAGARSMELSYKPVMDAAFEADMEDIVRNRKPRDTSARSFPSRRLPMSPTIS